MEKWVFREPEEKEKKYLSEGDYIVLDNDCNRGYEKAMVIRNMRNYLAKRNSTIIWGNGYLLESDEDKISDFFNKYQRQYKILELFFWLEEILSKYGRAIITINKTKDGEYKLNVPDARFLNAVGKSFYTEELAVVWQRIVQDTAHWYIKSTYDKYKVVNEVYVQKDGRLQAFDASIPLPKEAQVPKEWIHNLGFVPIVEVTNFPNKAWDPTFIFWNEQTDWYNSVAFESLFYQAYKDFKKELALCHSRIAIENGTQQQIQDLKEKMFGIDEAQEDILNDVIFSTSTGGKVTVQKGVNDFGSYTNSLEFIMDMYCKFSNSSRFSEGGGAQKTTQEVKINRSAQIEAITSKIALRETKYNELFAKLFTCYGLMNYDDEKWPFSFKVNGNIQKEETVFLDNIIKQVNLGTMSMVEAIAKLRNVSKQRATEIFEEIKDFNEENDVMTSLIGGDLGDIEFGESGKVGRPPDVVESDKGD